VNGTQITRIRADLTQIIFLKLKIKIKNLSDFPTLHLSVKKINILNAKAQRNEAAKNKNLEISCNKK
jgi:hypothetical protein